MEMKAEKGLYWKAARPDGWDFYTGKTINFRAAIGKVVKCPTTGPAKLCSKGVIHASPAPDGVFTGANLPMSMYRVEGQPVVTDHEKAGFKQLRVLEEVDPATIYKWDYQKAAKPVHPFRDIIGKLDDEALRLLSEWASVRASVRSSVGASVWASVWASVRDSVWASAGGSVWASVWASVYDAAGDSVYDAVRDAVWDSVWDSVWAYTGSVFTPVVKEWKYVKHRPGAYPFASAVKLWERGLVPSCDGEIWRLHARPKAAEVWKGKLAWRTENGGSRHDWSI